MSCAIRQATAADAAALARLNGQLGYPSAAGDLESRLPALLVDPRRLVLVAEQHGRAVGWVEVVLQESVVDPGRAVLTGLVVDEELRGHGIGRRLVEAAESWSRDHGYRRVLVRSRTTRADAHAFYARLGYRLTKTQACFRKET